MISSRRSLRIQGSTHYFTWRPGTREIIESVGTGEMVVGYVSTYRQFCGWFTEMEKEQEVLNEKN